jgi:drug/metabolite transporter (DMT)-like permease
VVAHALIGGSLVWDKILLRQPQTKNLLSYIFWLGFISIFGLCLIPFGFHIPSVKVIALALGTGLLELVANYFYYAALKAGEASQALAVMGGFTPAATVLVAMAFLKSPLGGSLIGFALMVAAGFVMFLSEKADVKKMLPSILLASGSFAFVNVFQKIIFNHTNFVSGYVFFTFGTFAGSLLLLARPSWRKQILEVSAKAEPRSRFWYFVNRFLAGVGAFLIVFAISRTSPSLVEAIAGVRYALIFVGAYLFTRLRPDLICENFTRPVLIGKSIGTLMVAAGLVFLAIGGKSRSSHPQAGMQSREQVIVRDVVAVAPSNGALV